ncbi:class A beta-lactamase-related serine hydrolase [bacterium]|nr:MAG: class A beta-lactamase-related serine hydrolase [bacterium]
MPKRCASRRRFSAGLWAAAFCALLWPAVAPGALAAGSAECALQPGAAARIDALVRREIESGHVPGVSLAVGCGGTLLYARGYGEADVARHQPARAGTTYAVGSLTKQFTAAAILLLAQDGALSLGDRLSAYVPELDGSGSITLRDLLQQRSGVPDYTRIPGLEPTQSIGWRAFIAAVNRLPAEFVPGSTYRYNNLNYLLLGRVVERISGESLGAFMARRITNSLGLDATGMLPQTQPQAIGYTLAGGAPVPATPWDPALLGGAGGLVSSAPDLVRWDAALFGGFLAPASLAAMTEPGGLVDGYAMGWAVERRGGERLLWHDGEVGGFQAANAVLPSRHLYLAVLENADSLHAPTLLPETLLRELLALLEPASAFGGLATAREHPLPADPTLAASVFAWVAQFESARIDRASVTPALAAALTPAALRATAAAWAGLGKPVAVDVLGHERRGELDVYVLRLRFAGGPFVWKISVAGDRLAGAAGIEPAR